MSLQDSSFSKRAYICLGLSVKKSEFLLSHLLFSLLVNQIYLVGANVFSILLFLELSLSYIIQSITISLTVFFRFKLCPDLLKFRDFFEEIMKFFRSVRISNVFDSLLFQSALFINCLKQILSHQSKLTVYVQSLNEF